MKNATLFSKNEMKAFEQNNPIFTPAQMKLINRKTPTAETEIKKDSEKKAYRSVKASYLKGLLLQITGGKYNFKVIRQEVIQATKEVLVLGELEIVTEKGTFTRQQFGQNYINTQIVSEGKTQRTQSADIGNSFKAAATDAFKKCCNEFGLAWDIYSQSLEEKPSEPTKAENTEHKAIYERLDKGLFRCTDHEHLANEYDAFKDNEPELVGSESKAIYDKHFNRITEENKK